MSDYYALIGQKGDSVIDYNIGNQSNTPPYFNSGQTNPRFHGIHIVTRLFVMMMMMMLCGTAWGQTTVDWGSISDNNGNDSPTSPIGRYFGWEYKVYCYRANTMNFSGAISSIAFLPYTTQSTAGTNTSSSVIVNGLADGNPMQIWMKEVSDDYALTANTTFATYADGATKVYSGNIPATTGGEYATFQLSTLFQHTQGNSILILVRTVSNGTTGDGNLYSYYKNLTGGVNLSWNKRQDRSDPGTGVSGSVVQNKLPVLRVKYVPTMECGTTYSGTLGTSGFWGSYSSCNYSEPGEEHVYAFTPDVTGSYTFSTTTTSGDPDFFIMNSYGNTGTNVVGGCFGSGSRTVTLTAGHTYYFIADNYYDYQNSGYTVTVTCPTSCPTTISSLQDWNDFCDCVNDGHDYAGETVTLEADLTGANTISTMAGLYESGKAFKGTFEGNGHTINVNIDVSGSGNTGDAYKGAAPFRYIDGATIQNLKVTGSVTSSAHHTAGLVGFCKDGSDNTIYNCLVSTNVTNNNPGVGTNTNNYIGGIIGHTQTSTNRIIGCVYNGTLTSAAFKGGMFGFAHGSTFYITDSYFGGNYSTSDNFSPIGCKSASYTETINFNNYYYNKDAGNFGGNTGYNGMNGATITNNGNGIYKHAYSVTGVGCVTVDRGSATASYNVSGITAYSTGIKYNGEFYGGNGDELALILGCTSGGVNGYSADHGTLSGSATSGSDDPYTLTMDVYNTVISTMESPCPIIVINNTADWNAFRTCVSNGYDYSGRTVNLMANISVTTMAGNLGHPFRGTFEGNAHTITVDYTANYPDNNDHFTAPFICTDGATIQNLRIDGTINMGGFNYGSGLIGEAHGNNTITNCVSNVTINSSRSGDGTMGGFIVRNYGQYSAGSNEGTTTFNGCSFTGSLNGTNTDNCAGFVAWDEYVNWSEGGHYGKVVFNDCLFAPTAVTMSTTGSATFSRYRDDSKVTLNNSYYFQSFGTIQGKQAYSVTGIDGVTVDRNNVTATYSVSGITAYSTGIKYNSVFYGGDGDVLSLILNYGGSDFCGYAADYGSLSTSNPDGTDDPGNLTMVAHNTQISPATCFSVPICFDFNLESYSTTPSDDSGLPQGWGRVYSGTEPGYAPHVILNSPAFSCDGSRSILMAAIGAPAATMGTTSIVILPRVTGITTGTEITFTYKFQSDGGRLRLGYMNGGTFVSLKEIATSTTCADDSYTLTAAEAAEIEGNNRRLAFEWFYNTNTTARFVVIDDICISGSTDEWCDDFEGATCEWDFINGTCTNAWVWGTATNNGGAHSMYISNDGGSNNAYSNNASMVYATKLLTFENGQYEFSYDWKAYGEGSYDYLRVALVPAPATFTAGTSAPSVPSGTFYNNLPTGWIAIDGSSKLNLNSNWQTKEVTINMNAGDYYLVFAWLNDGSVCYNPPAAIDNVCVKHIKCLKPTALSVTNISTTAATVSWTENGSATNWTVEYSTSSDFSNSTTVDVNTNPTTTLTGLSPLTHYYIRVRANCGGSNGNSDWISSNFTTTAEAVEVGDEWCDDFEGATCEWELRNGNLANAWAWGTATHNGSGSHAIYISNDGGTSNAYTNNISDMLVYATKPLTFATGYYEFSYDWKANGESSYDYIRVALLPADATFTAGTTIPTGFGTTSLPTGWVALDGGGKLNLQSSWQSKIETINVTAGNYYLVFAWKNDVSSGDQPPAAVDNVCVRIRTCPAPTNITISGSTVSWTESGTATSWTVEYSTTSDFSSNVQSVTVNTNPTTTIIGLTPGITYYVRVKAVCGVGDESVWSDVSTLCIPPTNRDCAHAITLNCGATLDGTTVCTPGSAHGIPDVYVSNYGVWYTFVGDGNVTSISSTAASGFNHEMDIMSGDCGSFTLIAARDAAYSGGTETYTFLTENGVTYYVYVAYYTSGSTTGTFTISRTCFTNPLTSATSLPCETINQDGTTEGTPDNAHGINGYDISNQGVWYTFTGDGNITTISTTTTTFNHKMIVVTGTYGNFTVVAEQNAVSGAGTETYTFQTADGETYYVYVAYYTSGSTTGTFTISRTCVDCGHTITLNSSQTVDIECGTSYCFFDSGGLNGSYGNSQNYTLTLTSTGIIHIKFETDLVGESGYDTMSIRGTTTEVIRSSSIPAGTEYTASTSGGTVTIHWRTDGTTVKSGWYATITAVDCCTERTGEFEFCKTSVNVTTSTPDFSMPLTNTLSPAGNVTYTSSDEGVATVNTTSGIVHVVGNGTTIITATVSRENISGTDYCSKMASYTVTVATAGAINECAQVGSGSATTYCAPAYGYNSRYSYTQQLYKADEIAFEYPCQKITDIMFWATSGFTQSMEIYMGTTTQTTIPSFWITDANLTLVYSGSVTFTNNDWTNIELDTPYEDWDGIKNIVVAVRTTTASSSSYRYFQSTDVTNGARYYWLGSSPSLNSNNVISSSADGTSSRPNIKFCTNCNFFPTVFPSATLDPAEPQIVCKTSDVANYISEITVTPVGGTATLTPSDKGLSYDSGTGKITGRPNFSGSQVFTVTVKDAEDCLKSETTFTITVNELNATIEFGDPEP